MQKWDALRHCWGWISKSCRRGERLNHSPLSPPSCCWGWSSCDIWRKGIFQDSHGKMQCSRKLYFHGMTPQGSPQSVQSYKEYSWVSGELHQSQCPELPAHICVAQFTSGCCSPLVHCAWGPCGPGPGRQTQETRRVCPGHQEPRARSSKRGNFLVQGVRSQMVTRLQ